MLLGEKRTAFRKAFLRRTFMAKLTKLIRTGLAFEAPMLLLKVSYCLHFLFVKLQVVPVGAFRHLIAHPSRAHFEVMREASAGMADSIEPSDDPGRWSRH